MSPTQTSQIQARDETSIWWNATASPQTTTPVLPEHAEHASNVGGGDGFIVIVYNNEHNTYAQVISILMQATACTQEEAEIETWEIDHLGQSVVHHGAQVECDRVAAVIRTIGIHVEVRED